MAILSLNAQCDKSKVNNPKPGDFAKGADVGWLTQMESAGIKFYNSSGVIPTIGRIYPGPDPDGIDSLVF